MQGMGTQEQMGAGMTRREGMRAVLLHMSSHVGGVYLEEGEAFKGRVGRKPQANEFAFDDWKRLVDRCVARKFNTLVMDIGDQLSFPNHPELAVPSGWQPERLEQEVARIRSLGLDAVPMLDFSATHDQWLKAYGRGLCTRRYYQVVRELIDDVFSVFGKVGYFHLGMGEEYPDFQAHEYIMHVRSQPIFLHDVKYLSSCVSRHGARPWIYSDRLANAQDHRSDCPKEVLQSPVFSDGDDRKARLRYAEGLSETGFDVVPAGVLRPDPVITCRTHLYPERLKGFLAVTERPCAGEANLSENLRVIDSAADALDGCCQV